MKTLRFPMFAKLLVGCFLLATLLIVGGTFVFKKETRPPAQGNYLAKHYRRYLGYEDRSGRGMTNVLEVVAEDARLRRALRGPSGPPANPPEDVPSIAAVGEALNTKLSGRNGTDPDLLALVNAKGELLWSTPGSGLKREEVPGLAAIEKIRIGSEFAHQLTLLNNTPYQLSGVPIRAGTDGEVLGGILAGVRVERYFNEYSEQSDDIADRRVRIAVLQGSDLLATSFPPDQRPPFIKAVIGEKFFKVVLGEEERMVIREPNIDLDYFAEDINAYRGNEKVRIAKIYLTRPRILVDDGKIPWPEIGIGVGFSIVIAFGMAYWITRPIKQFVRQSRELLQGGTDLTHRIVVSSRDETADLADNINQVFVRLYGLASDVETAAFQVGASSAEISAASKQMLSGIKNQSEKVESSSAAITELSASIQQVAENAAQATEAAEKSNVAITSAVQRMEQIRHAVDDAADKMRELGESSKRIGNIVEVIRQISEQTSLLALNAAIQAAQAGEHGRGFAVVADEVSSLARRAGQSAKDIEELIQTIKEQTAAAVVSAETGTTEVERGTQLVQATLADLGRLIGVVRDTAEAVREQAVVSDEIARNMDSVKQIADEVLTGSEESVHQAERLHDLAYQLEQSIGGFNLESKKELEGRGAASPPPAKPARSLPAHETNGGDAKKATRALPHPPRK